MDILSLFSLKERTAIVTGAGSGIGQAIALGFGKAGAKVLAVGHSSIDETRKKAEDQGIDVITTTADLSRKEEVERVVDMALREMGKVDILAYVSGTIRRSPAENHSLEDWDAVMNLNLRSAFYMSQLVGRDMLKRGYGKIIHIASMLTFMGAVGRSS